MVSPLYLNLPRLDVKTKLKEIAKTFAKSSFNEVDLRLEASQGEQLRKFLNDEYFNTPKYFGNLLQKYFNNKYVNGLRIDQLKSLKNKIDVNETTKRASQIFFNQVFRDGFSCRSSSWKYLLMRMVK